MKKYFREDDENKEINDAEEQQKTPPTGYNISEGMSEMLESGEQVYWYGQPSEQCVAKENSRAMIIPVVLMTVLIILFSLLTIEYFGFIMLVLPAIMVVQLLGAASRRTSVRVNKKDTYYTVTDRRVIIRVEGRIKKSRSIRYEDIKDIEIVENDDRRCGILVFKIKRQPKNLFEQNFYEFVDIADAERVLEIINAARRGN